MSEFSMPNCPAQVTRPAYFCANAQPNAMDQALATLHPVSPVVATPFFVKSICDKLTAPGPLMIALMQPDLVRRHRLTVEEYFRMAEVGLLGPEARVELIEGEVLDMAPVGHRHTSLISQLHARFLQDLSGQVSVWNQATFRLSQFSAPEPDLVLLKFRKDQYGRLPPSPEDVLLIVEVSENSPRYDRKVKLPLYARHNIPEVWIVDIAARRIHFFHTLNAGHYSHTSVTSAPGRISLHALATHTVDLTGLLEHLTPAQN